jgi:hypothetical protein
MQEQKTLAAHYTVEAQCKYDTFKVYKTQGSFEEEMQSTIIIKLRDKNCSKMCWQVLGLPCRHAYAAADADRNASVRIGIILARHIAGILLIHACVQDFNTKSKESSVAFDEHAVAPEFTPEFTLTDEFTSACHAVHTGRRAHAWPWGAGACSSPRLSCTQWRGR